MPGAPMKRGMTLIEVMVAGVVAFLVVGVAIAFLFTVSRNSHRIMSRSRLQQTGMTFLSSLLTDLQRANAGGISLIPEDDAEIGHCLIHPVREISFDGVPIYSDEELFYYQRVRAENKVYRRAFSRARPCPIELNSGEPMRFKIAQIPLLLRGRPQLRSYPEVAVFRIGTPDVDPGFVGNPLQIQIVMETSIPGRSQPERIVCARSLVLRNSL